MLTAYSRSTEYNHVRLLRQYVRLTGAGSEVFQHNEPCLHAVEGLFLGVAGDEGLEGITHALYEGDLAIDAHARYLTERRLVPSLRHIPFPVEIDPHHALEDARDIHFIRTPDNVVEYRSREEDPDGRPMYVVASDRLGAAPHSLRSIQAANPAEFKEGDLVEATVTFIAFPLGRVQDGQAEGYKLVVTLRGLTHLNREFREVRLCVDANDYVVLTVVDRSLAFHDLSRSRTIDEVGGG